MRLDHLLSKEMGEVGVALLFSYQGVSAEEDVVEQIAEFTRIDAKTQTIL